MEKDVMTETFSILDKLLMDDRVWSDTDSLINEVLNRLSTPLSIDELIILMETADTQIKAKKINVKKFV